MKAYLLITLLISFLSGCAMVEESSLQQELIGDWQIEYIKDKPVIDYSPARLRFAEDGTLSGNASCNNVSTRYSLSGDQLSVKEGAVTRKMCPPALMDQESRLLSALTDIRSARLDNGMLYLEGEDKQLIFKAAPVSTK